MFGAVAACRAKYRRSAVRAEAPPRGGSQTLAPRTSARELLGQSTASDKVLETGADTFVKTGNRLRLAQFCELRNRRTTKNGDRTTVRKQLFLINPPAPLRRQRTAESTCTTL